VSNFHGLTDGDMMSVAANHVNVQKRVERILLTIALVLGGCQMLMGLHFVLQQVFIAGLVTSGAVVLYNTFVISYRKKKAMRAFVDKWMTEGKLPS